MKHEWRKHEKETYLPKKKPQLMVLPKQKFFVVSGRGNPNSEGFQKHIEALYQASYAVRMSYKKDIKLEGYQEYAVYPLEGIWDINEDAKQAGVWTKDDLVYDLMIRQPDWLKESDANMMLERAFVDKNNPTLLKIRFEEIEDGVCVQMMHVGPYDDEPATFNIMEEYTNEISYKRKSKVHREIYISDFRKTEPEKLKTVLRFQVEK
jgi:hypothetical protein